jgi:D-threo-aldose 1-dehydrogenase
VDLDWVMLANSFTLYTHPTDLVTFMDQLHQKQIAIINAAVFNAGFLIGGDFFNYRKLDPNDADDREKFDWRERFFVLCKAHHVKATEVCIQFGKSHPGVVSLALSASEPRHIQENVAAIEVEIPVEFWNSIKVAGLINSNYPYL